jgi:methionyl-tRNA formyltransferase
VYEATLEMVRTFGAVKGKIGEVVEVGNGKIVVTSQSGRIHITKAKLGDGKKASADTLGITVGAFLGT